MKSCAASFKSPTPDIPTYPYGLPETSYAAVLIAPTPELTTYPYGLPENILDCLPPPQTEWGLVSRAKAAKVPCSCFDHQPHIHHCEVEHAQIPLESGVNTPMCAPIKGYDAMHLAHAAVKYFDRPEEQYDRDQKAAVAQIRAWYTDPSPNSLFHRLGTADPSLIVSLEEMEEISATFSRLFFLGAVQADIAWCDTPGIYGRTFPQNNRSRIEIHRTKTTTRERDVRLKISEMADDGMGTLLHEDLHCYLIPLQCIRCLSTTSPDGSHGRPFQFIAGRLKQTIGRLFGGGLRFPVDAQSSYWFDWNKGRVQTLPSECDLKQWEWAVTEK